MLLLLFTHCIVNNATIVVVFYGRFTEEEFLKNCAKFKINHKEWSQHFK